MFDWIFAMAVGAAMIAITIVVAILMGLQIAAYPLTGFAVVLSIASFWWKAHRVHKRNKAVVAKWQETGIAPWERSSLDD